MQKAFCKKTQQLVKKHKNIQNKQRNIQENKTEEKTTVFCLSCLVLAFLKCLCFSVARWEM